MLREIERYAVASGLGIHHPFICSPIRTTMPKGMIHGRRWCMARGDGASECAAAVAMKVSRSVNRASYCGVELVAIPADDDSASSAIKNSEDHTHDARLVLGQLCRLLGPAHAVAARLFAQGGRTGVSRRGDWRQA